MGSVLPKKLDPVIAEQISQDAVVIYSETDCGYADLARKMLHRKGISYISYDLDKMPYKEHMVEALEQFTGKKTSPHIFICDHHIGGYEALRALNEKGHLFEMVEKCASKREENLNKIAKRIL